MSAISTVSVPRPAGQGEPQAWRVRLPGEPQSAATARACVRAAIAAWTVPVDADSAALITGELVANAVQAAPGKGVALCVIRKHTSLRIEVHDTSPSAPALKHEAGLLDEAGRGLVLVEALASSWGWNPVPGGKSTFATLKIGQQQ